MNIGKRFKEERERLGLSQTQLGEIGGAGKTTVISWERGSAYPNALFLEKASSFGMDILYVITGARHENIATTSYELAFLRNCRAFKDNQSRQMALNALVAMSGYKSSLNEEGAYPANEPSIRLVAEQPQTYGSEEK